MVILSSIAPATLYTGSGAMQKRGISYLLYFPAMLAFGTGLCVNNALAVMEAVFKKKTAFIRTPKSGSSENIGKKMSYKINSKMLPALIELILGLYCAYSFTFYFNGSSIFFGVWMFAYAVGLIVFSLSTIFYILKQNKKARD